MKVRKLFAILGAVVIFACCVMIYLMLDETLFPQGRWKSVNDNKWVHIENRLAKLEQDFKQHHRTQDIPQLKRAIPKLPSKDSLNEVIDSIPKEKTKCNIDTRKVPNVDIQMLNVYKQLEFDDVDGGVWKQGFDISYDEKQWHPKRKLKVFVVPHSHNDPGWLKTFEEYYDFKTRSILSNMLIKLNADKRRKFIWAEISFFKMWWDEQSAENRARVKRLVDDGQLELVAGGWVMPDESVSHWISQLMQLTEGHQWLKANLDYTPSCGWAIDPFGLSPTMPYLLKNSGLENIVIQRVHYSVKKKLAKEKNLEFRWRQLWDNQGTTEIFTHMMPFYSYDVPHTCGPNPKVCCQFDFFRLPKFGLTCPWKMNPKPIDVGNVANRVELLLDQYRKKAQLYKTDAVLIPLGDDFRYSQASEWDEQYENYQRLFDYINSQSSLNVDIRFGTLKDYFDQVRKSRPLDHFPSLSGDFFTYADREDHYWSGYYTSRPFHKRLDRVLLSGIRGSEIAASLAWIRGHQQLAEGTLAARMKQARKWHSLFQHHDGVTGTSKDHVVIDYARKMIVALNNSAHVLQQSVMRLLHESHGPMVEPETVYLAMDEQRSHHTSPGEKHVLSMGEETPVRKIVVYNPLPRRRTKVQTFFVSTPFVRVTDQLGRTVECQISPVWDNPAVASNEKYQLSFVVTVPALGLTTYIVHALHGTTIPKQVHIAQVTLYNSEPPLQRIPGFDDFKVIGDIQDFSIKQKPEMSVSFGRWGLLKAIHVDDTTFPVLLKFVKYGTSLKPDRNSGAYLFLPDKKFPDQVEPDDNVIVHVVEGPIISQVFVQVPYVRHTCILHNSPGIDGFGLHIINQVDVSEGHDFELAMRLETDIDSENEFFTDLNGLNMIKRERFSKIPLQGNYYPMAAAAFIEDSRVRMTALTAQPLGVSSLSPGQLEIMQDRRLSRDDNRGMEQGVTDNLLTSHMFTLVMEKKVEFCNENVHPDHPSGLLSVAGHLLGEELLHPIVVLHPRATTLSNELFELSPNFSPLRSDFPSDVDLVNLRVLPVPEGAGKGVGIVLRRNALDRCWGGSSGSNMERFKPSENGQVDLRNLLLLLDKQEEKNDWTISDAPLTFHSVGASRKSSILALCPFEVKSVLFHKI